MPAAAVIPAPIAYAKVVAVKKLVVGFFVVYFEGCFFWWGNLSTGQSVGNIIFGKFLVVHSLGQL